MIIDSLKKLLEQSVKEIENKQGISIGNDLKFEIEVPNNIEHGDLSTNLALVIASNHKLKPRQIAESIVEFVKGRKPDFLDSISLAGPGFINFKINKIFYLRELSKIYSQGADYGKVKEKKKMKVQVEFVSANPTGPLHIGHGRGAVFGDVIAAILSECGYQVKREYYVNDAGNQIQTLGKSVYIRIQEINGQKVEFPPECYQGDYIKDIAKDVIASKMIEKLDEAKAITKCGVYAGDRILAEIKDDLKNLGVIPDDYFFESTLHKKGLVEKAIDALDKKDLIYDRDGAKWFKSTQFGDDKDRVLTKGTGLMTYFAADIAYHLNKFKRGFDKIIDIWGADHAGYVLRTKSAVSSLMEDKKEFDIILIQFVNLIRGGKQVSMSTRAATYETLKSVLDEVGRDACRYFFLMRSHNAKLDFDLELAKKQAPENPVFYIQYAHARISSVFQKAHDLKIKYDFKKIDLKLIDLPEEVAIAKVLLEYPAVIEGCGRDLEPHQLAFYLHELAQKFQSYYSKGQKDERYKLLSDDVLRCNSKLYFLKNIQIVLQNGLRVLGILAPDRMD